MKKSKNQNERTENSTVDISFTEKKVTIKKEQREKRKASMEITLEKTMSNKLHFPADPVFTIKIRCYPSI